jgi:enamine deaminase RidA (YjgF/YER057c/UK114 family)
MATRKSIEIPGVHHQNPIPMGAKIGNMVYSSAISGLELNSRTPPPDPDKQAEVLFRNIRTFMDLAGGTPDDIIRMTVYVKEEQYRDSINKEWLKMFPDEKNRPARHTLKAPVRGEALFQVEVIAVL